MRKSSFACTDCANSLKLVLLALVIFFALSSSVEAAEQIQVGFLWHMHQPIYYPYESIVDTESAGLFSFSLYEVHNTRVGPYTSWPYDAIQTGSSLSHLGAQISFTGSLIENLNNCESAGVGGGMWNNWDWAYDLSQSATTALGNRRLDLVAFGYHHPLMPLLDEEDLRMQIRLHKHVYAQTWTGGSTYSSGMFPPETAFSERMIPTLVEEGIDWVIVDNIHFDRACVGFPHIDATGIYRPNPADQINPNPADAGGAWVQLNNLWAPSRVSAPFGYQPHYVQHVDPQTGAIVKMVAIPGARYEGNEDARGGYGAFLYDQVMDQYLAYNTDAAHPMFVMLHHDGDNFGGGSDSYYHSNWQNMVNWVSGDPDYDVTTVDDYLDRFPPALNDVIHVEDGSWAGADSGDPEFKKWLGDPDGANWSPDRNSWAVLTAAKNRVFTAENVAPASNMQNVLTGSGSNTERAWHYLLCSQASDYWYWDGTEIWDSNVTRGCNQAVVYADAAIAGQEDNTAPTIFLPQREPYNPGGYEFGSTPQPNDFTVWTYVYDVSGLSSVTLHWRVDADGSNPIDSIQNETYAGGVEVGSWNNIAMSVVAEPGPQNGVIAATYRASQYAATIADQQDALIDYYVSAIDTEGNEKKSPILHVYVGLADQQGSAVEIDPDPAQAGQSVTVSYDAGGGALSGASEVYLHYGFDGWSPTAPDEQMTFNTSESVWQVSVPVAGSASQLDMAFTDGDGIWDNNGGQDWHFVVEGGQPQDGWELDGSLDEQAVLVAENNGMVLYAGIIEEVLYLATWDAGEGNDHFLFLADTPGAMTGAPWAKAGSVASWDAYVGNENGNSWAGWTDASGDHHTATGGGSGYLEATINLVQEFGTMPETIHLAVAPYEDQDGGALQFEYQVPQSLDDDTNLQAGEYVEVSTCSITIGNSRADLNGDCSVDLDDFAIFASCIAGPDVTTPPAMCSLQMFLACDFKGNDGDVDLADFAAMLELWPAD